MENRLAFTCSEPGRNEPVRCTLDRKKDILVFDMLPALPGWQAFLARVIGVRPW